MEPLWCNLLVYINIQDKRCFYSNRKCRPHPPKVQLWNSLASLLFLGSGLFFIITGLIVVILLLFLFFIRDLIVVVVIIIGRVVILVVILFVGIIIKLRIDKGGCSKFFFVAFLVSILITLLFLVSLVVAILVVVAVVVVLIVATLRPLLVGIFTIS